MAEDEDSFVRLVAAGDLGRAFSLVPDKTMAWQDLHRLTGDEDRFVRWIAARALGEAFSLVPDKTMAWQDLHRLTGDEGTGARREAANALGAAFSQVPDKTMAWQDLHRLTGDEDISVRLVAARALGEAFSHVPDKTMAWQDLHRLTQDGDSYVRRESARALGEAFSLVPDKTMAWQDLHRLTADEDREVRWRTARALGEAFSHVPDKNLAWQDLHRLTGDEESYVRMYAYHSLGRASVFKATESDDRDTMKTELEAAIVFFEISSQEDAFSSASFCDSFYHPYFSIAFQEANEDKLQRDLAEAKDAVGGSESKNELLLVVEKLAQALDCWYYEKAASHMATAEKSAPSVGKLKRKHSLILDDEKTKATIAEIQKKAREIGEITCGSGTVYEAPGALLQKAAKALSADDLSSIQKYSSRIVWQLRKLCTLLPAEDKKQFCGILEEIEHEPEIPEMLNGILTALLCLGPVLADKSPPLADKSPPLADKSPPLADKSLPLADVVILTILPEEYGSIRDRLSELGPPPDMGSLPNLYAWKFGKVSCQNLKADYKIAVGMIGRAGTTEGALAAREAVQLWRPRYVIFCGIAGGLPDSTESNSRPRLGDVVVADIIYGYEYGKLERKFKPRSNWTYRADQALLTGSMAYSLSDGWRKLINAEPPRECMPHVIMGEIASGDKVVDNPSNGFFAKVLKKWPRINAVEMEGAGAAAAIEQAGSQGITTRFMMIRGISDLPRAKGKNKGRKERDAWKAYASDAAAAFVMGWIGDGLPLPPFARTEDL